MSTNSHIFRQKPTDKTVLQCISIHWDGYPNGVGKTLFQHWNDPEKVAELFNLGKGYLSSIHPTMDTIFAKDEGRMPTLEIQEFPFGADIFSGDVYYSPYYYLYIDNLWYFSKGENIYLLSDILHNCTDLDNFLVMIGDEYKPTISASFQIPLYKFFKKEGVTL